MIDSGIISLSMNKSSVSLSILFLVFLGALVVCLGNEMARAEKTPPDRKVHDFTVETIDGEKESLAKYRGRALLIVNTASQCGFTPQYKGLQALYERYRDQGFSVLAFPANNFKNQEPGSNAEIKNFCALMYKTTFPIFAKISVKGDDMDPLYRYLTTESGFPGDIGWNFNKFLVDPGGKVVARYDSMTDPQDPKLIDDLKKILPGSQNGPEVIPGAK